MTRSVLVTVLAAALGCTGANPGSSGGGSGGTGGGGTSTGGGVQSTGGGVQSTGGGVQATGGGVQASGGGVQATGGGGSSGASDGGITSGPDPIPDHSGNPTSLDRIAAAVDAGTLTAAEGILYGLYADFADPRLPPQYQGDDVGLIEPTAQLAAVTALAQGASVPAATLDEIRRFFVPPYIEGSWWNQRNPTATRAPSNPNCKAWESACSFLTEWERVAGTHVVVWYQKRHAGVDGPRAASLVYELDSTIWPKLTTLMGTPLSDQNTGLINDPDGRLDVILTELPATQEGATFPSTLGCKKVPVHIYLNRSLPAHGLQAQAAHEVMHAIQFSFDVKARCVTDYKTSLDATAVWATNYVYPTNDWEHRYAKNYLEGNWVENPYDSGPVAGNKNFAYGAYLLPLFLETRFGPPVVRGIWDQAVVFTQELFAIDAAIGAAGGAGARLEKEWPRFLAANWNRDGLDTYRKLDRLTTSAYLDPSADKAVAVGASGLELAVNATSVSHAAAQYFRFTFDSSVRAVAILNGLTFTRGQDDPGFGPLPTFTGQSALARQGASMQVYLKVNGTWQAGVVNLSSTPWSWMCRSDPAGKVDEMIVIYGNAEISSSAPNYQAVEAKGEAPAVLASNQGCRDWTGTLTMSRPLPGGSEVLRVTNAVMQNTQPTAAPQPMEDPGPYPVTAGDTIPAPYGYVYGFTSGSAQWTYDSQTSSCTYTGRGAPMLNSFPAHTLTHFALPGAAARAMFFTGFLDVFSVGSLTVDWRCVDGQGKVTTGTDVVGTNLDVGFSPLDTPRVMGGLSISGTGAQSDSTATGTWSLTGAN